MLKGGTRCKFAGWGSVSADHEYPKYEFDLRELKNEPVMNTIKCTLRTYFRDVKPKNKVYSILGLTQLLKRQCQFRRKFQFCIDLQKGPPRGAGAVS